MKKKKNNLKLLCKLKFVSKRNELTKKIVVIFELEKLNTFTAKKQKKNCS